MRFFPTAITVRASLKKKPLLKWQYSYQLNRFCLTTFATKKWKQRRSNIMVSAIAGWFFNETLKYNLWILMSCQMMPKRWFSIIINASAAASTSPAPRQTAPGWSLWSLSGPGHQLASVCKNTQRNPSENVWLKFYTHRPGSTYFWQHLHFYYTLLSFKYKQRTWYSSWRKV